MNTQTNKKKMCDIARLAGVSASTVSRALNDSPLVSETTRKKIKAIAEQHHYAINKQAQNLRLQSSKTISVMIPIEHAPNQHISDPFFLEMLGAIADRLTEANYELLLSRVYASNWRSKVINHNYADGLIVLGQSTIHDDINQLAEQKIMPLVVWGAQLEQQHYVTVGSDNVAGGRLAGKHLLNKDRRKLVFLGDISLPEVKQRYEGFCEALNKAGLEHNKNLVVHATFTQESAMTAMHVFQQKGIPFDGIFAASDVLATCAVKSLTTMGKRVPADVSIVGYDDVSLAGYMSPAITTVAQQIPLGGITLVDLLFKQIRGEPAPSVIIAPKIIERDT